MVKKIIKAISNYQSIQDYKIIEVQTNTTEQFYDLQRLETTRCTNTLEINVSIYVEKEIDGKKKIGNSNFIVSHNLSSKDLNTLIEDAIYATTFINNEYYELVTGDGKKSFKQKKEDKEPFECLQDIAEVFFSQSNEICKFNALELFYDEYKIHLINSKGVDYTKITHQIKAEAIPSYKKDDIKTELYRMFVYDKIDLKKIKEDANDSLKDVVCRAEAKQNTFKGKINVILKDDKIKSLIEELISTYDYADVYRHSNYKNIGDMMQENAVCPLTISLKPSSKGHFFDADGVLLKEVSIIQKGKVIDYYGNNRFAYYLNKTANGRPDKIALEKGLSSEKALKKNAYIEIVDLSGIQLDLFANYIGGEIRLATYFDGENTYPISGLSFSGNLTNCINSIELSKEVTNIQGYEGPKYALLKDTEVM